MLKVINIYGGPGTGKSTCASEVFTLMKKKGYKCELVTEVAKDMVYSEEFFAIKDQLMVFARQHHKLWKLRDKVDYAIVDSPLPLSLVYAPKDMIYASNILTMIVMDTYNKYENQNFLMTRSFGFQEYGRVQDEEESIIIDLKIKDMLIENRIPHKLLDPSNAAEAVLANVS